MRPRVGRSRCRNHVAKTPRYGTHTVTRDAAKTRVCVQCATGRQSAARAGIHVRPIGELGDSATDTHRETGDLFGDHVLCTYLHTYIRLMSCAPLHMGPGRGRQTRQSDFNAWLVSGFTVPRKSGDYAWSQECVLPKHTLTAPLVSFICMYIRT